MINKTVTITEKHNEWLKTKCINLSALVRAKIDSEIKARGSVE